MMKLKLVPIQGKPEFHQKCYCSVDVFKKICCYAGSFIQLTCDTQSSVCCIWPDSALAPGSVRLNHLVSCFNQKHIAEYKFITANKTSGETTFDWHNDNVTNSLDLCQNMIKVLKTCLASSVSIDVILNDAHAVKKANLALKSLAVKCKTILLGLHVMDSFVINCQTSKLSKLCGISHIIIRKHCSSKSADSNTCFKIHEQTDVSVNSAHSKQWFDQMFPVKKVVRKPGGLDNVINMLLDLIQLPFEHKDKFSKLGAEPPKGVLLSGPPGCGKTSLIRYVCQTNHVLLRSINGPEVFGPHPGESEGNLRNMFNEARLLGTEGPCILFIDEIDSICPRTTSSSKPQEERISAQLLKLMDELRAGDDILVIGATNRPDGIHQDLRRPGRLDREILIMPPTTKQRLDILLSQTHDLPVANDLDVHKLSEITNGYVGADLACLCQEASYLALSESSTSDIPLITQSYFLSAFKKIRPSLQKGSEGVVDLRPVSWSDIGGLHDVKLQIQQAVEWPLKHPDAFERMGLKPPRGVLLYGPPGCCKTTLVRAAATACHCTFLSISGAQLYSPYVGDSERLISRVFQKARACAPTVLFLDELDSIVGKRSDEGGSRGVQERILSTLLNEMDGVGVRLSDGATSVSQKKMLEGQAVSMGKSDKMSVSNTSVLVVAATNRPDLIDDALMRPGRMDRIVYVPPPDIQARKEIFTLYAAMFKLSDSDVEDLASRTEFFTGADIESLCREAALQALTEDIQSDVVLMEHFIQAFNSVSPTLNKELLSKYSKVKL